MTGFGMLRGCSLFCALTLIGCGGSNPPSPEGKPGKPDSTAPQPESSGGEKSESNKKSKTPEQTPEPGESPGGSQESEDAGEDEPGAEDEPKFDIGIPESESGKEDVPCDIDFLFVVDNSRSMVDNQKSLANSVPGFINTIKTEIKNLESYHIGVISTDESQYNTLADVKHCSTLGGLIVRTADFTPSGGKDFDRHCYPYATEGKSFMTMDDDLGVKFTCAANVGPMGNGNERPMDALEAAMGDALNKKDACNDGFFRERAILVVVIVSDEEDDIETEDGFTNGSKGEPEDWYKRVLEFKNNKEELVVVLSLVGNPKPNQCDYTYEPGGEPKDGEGIKSAEVSRRLIEFTQKFGKQGVVGDICADNYDDFFKKAVTTLALACEDIPQ